MARAVPAPRRTVASPHRLRHGNAARLSATRLRDSAVIGDMRPATALARGNDTPSQLSTPHRTSKAYSISVATGSTAAAPAAIPDRRGCPDANATSPRPMHTNPNAVPGTITRHPGTRAAGVRSPDAQLPSTTAATAVTTTPVVSTGTRTTRLRAASAIRARPPPGERKDLIVRASRAG